MFESTGEDMGFWGALIMSVFGTVFMMFSVGLLNDAHGAFLALPVLLLVVFLAYLFQVRRGLKAIHRLSEKASKVVTWCSVGEGVGILLAVNVVRNISHPDWVLPAIAFVVGLHFLPMAFAIPFKAFYALGALLIAGSIIGVLLPQPMGAAMAGLVAGFGLWVAAVLAIRREQQWALAVAPKS
jgi:hypothetical protein